MLVSKLNLKVEEMENVITLETSNLDRGIVQGFVAFNVVSAVVTGAVLLT